MEASMAHDRGGGVSSLFLIAVVLAAGLVVGGLLLRPSGHALERVRDDPARADIPASIERGDCIPELWVCQGNKAYLVCPGLRFGKYGLAPMYLQADGTYRVATWYYLSPERAMRLLAREGCVRGGITP